MLRQLAFRDFLLIALSVAVIVLSNWPTGQDRQTICYRDSGGHVQQYSLPVDDPRLLSLVEQLRERKDGRFSEAVAVARWGYELAGYYAQQTGAQQTMDDPSPGSGLVMPVAFEQPVSDLPDEVTPDKASYWLIAQQRAEQELRWAERQLADSADAPARPAVELGAISPSTPGLAPLALAAMVGIIVAFWFERWSRACPAICLCEANQRASFDASDSKGAFARSPLEMEIPAEWVRVHQPLRVHLRRFGYAAIVTAAMISLYF